MSHINEDMLIQYAFDLLEAEQRKETARHLEQCPDCQKTLERIQRQFAALDVLGEDAALSAGLIQKTLVQKAANNTIPFYRKVWVEWTAAAAAVTLICVLLFQTLPGTHVKEPAPGEFGSPIAKLGVPAGRAVSPLSAARSDEKTESIVSDATGAVASIHEAKIVSADAIPDKPPFAPASAIELVVLPNPDKMQLTIYNSADLTLVRDTRRLTLKPGWNRLQFMWDGTLIDPTSLSLTPLAHADKIDIQQLVYPARLKDIGRWLIRSEVEGSVPFEMTYFASGLSWRAFYMGTMNENETTMNLKGYVNVANNSGQDFVNAQTRLVIGETHLIEQIPDLSRRRYPYGPDIFNGEDSRWKGKDKKVPLRGDIPILGRFFSDRSGGVAGEDLEMAGGTSLAYEIKKIEKEGLSEYFLYTIEGTEDLPNTWAKRLPSFDVADIPVKSLYKYDEDRYGTETMRFVSFKNDAEHELGETPIPEGKVKIYRTLNEAQNLSYIGGADIKYIPVNEDVELNLGAAQLVKVEPVLMQTKTDNYLFDPNSNITGWDTIETWKLELTNTCDIPVELEITRNFRTDHWEMDLGKNAEGLGYKKHDKNRARFTIALEPRTQKAFAYTVTRYQGTRSEIYVKKQNNN